MELIVVLIAVLVAALATAGALRAETRDVDPDGRRTAAPTPTRSSVSAPTV